MSQTALLFVAAAALACSGVMAAVAWRLARREQRRSEARIAVLAADIHGIPRDAAAPSAAAGGARTIAGVVLGVAVLGAIAAVAILASGSTQVSPGALRHDAHAGAPALQLTALAHDRDGDGLTVRGIVRNPRGAPSVKRVIAVVSVYNAAGALAASGRAPVQHEVLDPGSESTFVVSVPGVADVARYRISFNSGDEVIPHVDRRTKAQTARTP